jgi:hypothetical protein
MVQKTLQQNACVHAQAADTEDLKTMLPEQRTWPMRSTWQSSPVPTCCRKLDRPGFRQSHWPACTASLVCSTKSRVYSMMFVCGSVLPLHALITKQGWPDVSCMTPTLWYLSSVCSSSGVLQGTCVVVTVRPHQNRHDSHRHSARASCSAQQGLQQQYKTRSSIHDRVQHATKKKACAPSQDSQLWAIAMHGCQHCIAAMRCLHSWHATFHLAEMQRLSFANPAECVALQQRLDWHLQRAIHNGR